MDIPAALFTSHIIEGNIYYFITDQIDSIEPHHYICLKKSDKIVMFACCTSKPESMMRFVASRKLSEDTIVTIPALTPGTELKKHTYVNCNSDPVQFSIKEFENRFTARQVKATGTLDREYFDKIINGIILSTLVDEETKEFITS